MSADLVTVIFNWYKETLYAIPASVFVLLTKLVIVHFFPFMTTSTLFQKYRNRNVLLQLIAFVISTLVAVQIEINPTLYDGFLIRSWLFPLLILLLIFLPLYVSFYISPIRFHQIIFRVSTYVLMGVLFLIQIFFGE